MRAAASGRLPWAATIGAAWLHDLLLTTAGGVKSFGSSTSSHHAGSTTDSGDADATDECFASLGGDKVASAL